MLKVAQDDLCQQTEKKSVNGLPVKPISNGISPHLWNIDIPDSQKRFKIYEHSVSENLFDSLLCTIKSHNTIVQTILLFH